MKKLMELIEAGCSDIEIAAKAKEMYQSGELNDMIQLLSFAMAGDPLTKEQAQRIASLYFEYEVGIWQEIIPNFWVRKDADDCFTAAVVYPDIKGHAFCYCFSANLKEYTNAQIQAYEEACQPPEHVINLELRKVYSILASLDLSKATDRYVAAYHEDLELWLKKCAIQREPR